MALKISQSGNIPAFLAMEVMSQANELEVLGDNILHLEIGQPSTPPPSAVLDALTDSLKHKASHGYSVAMGNPRLRQRIAAHYYDWYSLSLDWQQIAITPGSSLGFIIAFLAAFDTGDRIALATPGYPAYFNSMKAVGLEPQLLMAQSKENWMPNLEMLVDNHSIPDGLLLASPANPTGFVMTDEELQTVCEWCERYEVRLIMDEIYHGLTFGKRTQSALAYNKNAIVINSFSKYFCMTGWRLGWIIIPDELIPNVERLAQNMYISASTINQLGAVAAFDCYDELDDHIPRYQENRDLLYRGLPDVFLGNHAPSNGAFYLYADVGELTDDSVAFASRMLSETGVALTPGLDFDRVNGNTHVRLSYAGATNDIKEAIERINQWICKRHSK